MKNGKKESEEKLLKDADRYVDLLVKSGKVELEKMDPESPEYESVVTSNVGKIRVLRSIVVEYLRNERYA